MDTWDAVVATQIFGMICFGVMVIITASYRKKIGKFAALIFPLTVTLFTLLSYTIFVGPEHNWISTFFTLFMLVSWLVTVFYLLKSIEEKRRLF